MSETDDTISVDRVLHVLRRWRWLVLSLVIAGAVVGALLALTLPPRYEATATVLVGTGNTSSAPAPGQLTALAASRLVRTQAVAEAVSRELADGRSPGELLDAVSTAVDDSEAFIDVTAVDDTPEAAAELANAFAEEFIAVRRESVGADLEQSIEATERRLEDLERRSPERTELASTLAELRATAVVSAVEGEVVDPALPNAAQNSDTPVRWGLAGGGLGLLLGLVLAFTLGALDPRVRSLWELRGLVSAPQLAALPAARRRPRPRARPPVLRERREPLEHLRGALLNLNGGRKLQRIAVASANDRKEGKTAVAAGLAVSLARLGLRVCVVDTDLRRPALAARFGLDDAAVGLADAVQGTPLADVVQRFSVPADDGANGRTPEQGPEIDVVAAGSPSADAAEVLASQRAQAVLDELDRSHDVTILDCAPVLAVSDALPLLEHTSGTILVVRHSHTPRRSAVRAARVIAGARGAILGVVATGVPKGELAAEGHGPWPAFAPAASQRGR